MLRGAMLAAAFGLALAPAVRVEAAAQRLDPQREIEPFAHGPAAERGLPADYVARILASARVLPQVIERISRPAEALPWYRYRKIFLTDERVAAGREFVRRNAGRLAAARERFGVPARVVAAIIGVESFYGRHRGKLRVLDALATLGFRYPRRGEFFRRELADFLLLAREQSLDPLRVTGSYAGAMGLPQFIPSSYRHYAVDFDGDGARDLIGSVDDAIGSVANYLREHGWRAGQPVAFEVDVEGERHRPWLQAGLEPSVGLDRLADYGVNGAVPAGAAGKGALIEVDGAAGKEYWVGLGNFYAITRYNHSGLYALAVHLLARALGARGG